ncbi:MAG: hypothetical protein J5506_10345 [Prevotella sp.]|nr:hypothetical protein [Prevotella sp.]
METNIDEYKEMMHDVHRALNGEKDRLTERIERLQGLARMADATDGLLAEIEALKDENKRLDVENEQLGVENKRLREEVREKDMKLSELSKLSVGMARKTSHDEVLKALRTYMNISKRKTLSKRVAVKMMIMELANTIGLTLPEDMIATLEVLDDEQSEPKVVVQGDYVEHKVAENKFDGPVGQVVERVEKLEYSFKD